MKTVLGVAIGLMAGVIATLIVRPALLGSTDDEQEIGAESEPSAAARDDTLARRVFAIEARLDDLTDEIQNLTSGVAAMQAADSSRSVPEVRALSESIRTLRVDTPGQTPSENLVERLVAGGFSPARAEWIQQFQNEQAMAAIEARYEGLRNGAEPVTVTLVSTGGNPALRQELGDAEYEQYLRALGRNPSVDVMEVLANSPAERAGFRAGDRVLAYGGTRVFDLAEVTPLTAQGNPGEPVVVEILRDGQPMQIVVPRGPLGVRLMSSGGDSFPIGVAQPQ